MVMPVLGIPLSNLLGKECFLRLFGIRVSDMRCTGNLIQALTAKKVQGADNISFLLNLRV